MQAVRSPEGRSYAVWIWNAARVLPASSMKKLLCPGPDISPSRQRRMGFSVAFLKGPVGLSETAYPTLYSRESKQLTEYVR